MSRRMPAKAWGVGLALVALGLTACKSPSPSAEGSGCARASQDVVAALQERLEVEGTLRHAFVVPSASGVRFVSAERLLADEHTADDKGDILTWAMTDEQADAFVAVDEKARNESSWPEGEFNVTTDGAMESRGCTYLTAGAREFTEDEMSDCTALAARKERRACTTQADVARELDTSS